MIAAAFMDLLDGTIVEVVLGQVPVRLAGSASGVVSTITQLGSVVAVTVTGAIFFGTLGDHPLPATFVHATTHSLWYLTASCAAAAAGCTLLPAHRPAPAPDQNGGASTTINTPDGPIVATPADP